MPAARAALERNAQQRPNASNRPTLGELEIIIGIATLVHGHRREVQFRLRFQLNSAYRCLNRDSSHLKILAPSPISQVRSVPSSLRGQVR
jgi:hypothetical protein